MLKNKQDVSNFLKDKNISPTSQRVEMLYKLLQKEQHLSPEVIYQMVNDEFPKVSRATVYNNLNLFIENGIVKKHSVGSLATVFDTNSRPHYHLHEENSEQLIDLNSSEENSEKLAQVASTILSKKMGSGYKLKDIIINFEKV